MWYIPLPFCYETYLFENTLNAIYIFYDNVKKKKKFKN